MRTDLDSEEIFLTLNNDFSPALAWWILRAIFKVHLFGGFMIEGNWSNEKNDLAVHSHVLCWRSAFAGLAIGILTFVGVISLSLAFGGIALEDGSTLKNATIFAGLSVVIAMVLGNFVGSYYSVRIVRFKVDVVGVMQGLLVGALGTLIVITHAMTSVVALGKVTGAAFGGAVAVAGSGAVTNAPLIEDIIADNLGNRKFVSEPEVVVRNVASRLLRGDEESAKSYLVARQGFTRADAEQSIAMAKAKIDQVLEEARKAASDTLKAIGWSAFVAIVLATIASALGGMAGALCNARRMIDIAVVKK